MNRLVLSALLFPVLTNVLYSQNTKSCDLSSLKIKDVKIENDDGDNIANALLSELYKKRAVSSSEGLQITGKATLTNESPTILTVRVINANFASTVEDVKLVQRSPGFASNVLAMRTVEQFCKILNARKTPK